MRPAPRTIHLWILAIMTVSSFIAGAQEFGKVVYNRYSFHYQITPGRRRRPPTYQASCLGNIDPGKEIHGFLSVNSKVILTKDRSGVTVTSQADPKKKITLYFKAAYMNNMTIEEYVNLLFSPTKVDYDGLNKADVDGIRRGMVLKGMTRTGVLVALGYPPIHRTHSLEEDIWTYWKDRSKIRTITFKDGKVDTIKN